MAKFTANEKEELRQELDNLIAKCDQTSRDNQSWDIFFKVTILAMSLVIAICSGLAAAEVIANSKLLSIVATILATISTVLSVFAFNQFNFSARQQLWRSKTNAFSDLRYRLLYLDSDKESWGRLKIIVESWNDSTPIEQAKLPESPNAGTP